ncbi:MAG: PepSY domain-containing protein [Acidobacteriia bacterium]|nr:PepSY domain-containing protein [Terriglobia bacterium]
MPATGGPCGLLIRWRKLQLFSVVPALSSTWRTWVGHPQRLSARQFLFRIHSWIGVGAGLYVVMMSLTGCVLVFYAELYRGLTPHPHIEVRAKHLTRAQLKEAALKAHPGSSVTWIWERSNLPVEIWLTHGRNQTERLFDPFTGEDLGTARPFPVRLLNSVKDLHTNLCSGASGRRVNGLGAALLASLASTGIVIWWPGVSRWRRHLRIRRHLQLRRFHWEFHSAVGFWTFPLVFIFAVTAAVLITETTLQLRVPSPLARLSYTFHVGQFPSMAMRILWASASLFTAFLAITGLILWWNRRTRMAGSH